MSRIGRMMLQKCGIMCNCYRHTKKQAPCEQGAPYANLVEQVKHGVELSLSAETEIHVLLLSTIAPSWVESFALFAAPAQLARPP